MDSTSITPDIILDVISELCGVDVGKMTVRVEVDPEGFVVRFVFYCRSPFIVMTKGWRFLLQIR